MANPDPTLNDWVEAYKPLDAAINHAFETRITKTNAVSTQFHLAEVRPTFRVLELRVLTLTPQSTRNVLLTAPCPNCPGSRGGQNISTRGERKDKFTAKWMAA